jgi:hypothetical protein
VDILREREALDRDLVLRRDDRAPVGIPEARRSRVAVDRDHKQAALAGRREQPDLRGARA